MKDIQGQRDHRRINIKKVGVKNISYPISLLDKARTIQRTVATVNMYVNLPHLFKGTHMSRFIEILNRFHGEINLESFHLVLHEMKEKLQAEAAHMEIEFPYFLKRARTGAIGTSEYLCKMHGSLEQKDDLVLEIKVPVAPPQPPQASQGMPRSLGHWGMVDIAVRFRHFIWIEDLIDTVEGVTRHDLCWPTTPAQSECTLTVEGITKALGHRLAGHPDIKWFSVRVENLAAGFTTFAMLEWPEKPVEIPPTD